MLEADPARQRARELQLAKWTNGEIADGGKAGLIALAIFTTLWSAIAFPAAYVVLHQPHRHADRGAMFVLIFPTIGLLLLLAVIFAMIRRRRFGTSYFRLDVIPASPGAVLTGTIRVTRTFEPAGGVLLRLVCVNRRRTGSGDNAHTSETLLWEESSTVQPQGLRGIEGVIIPVQFALPPSAPTTDTADPSDDRTWRLTARASLPGPDYFAQFELPVYETPESIQAIESAKLANESRQESGAAATATLAEPVTTDAHSSPPTEPGVTTMRRIDGGWDFTFSAGRNKGFAFILLIFGLIFSGSTAFLIYTGCRGWASAGGIGILFVIVPLLMAVPFSLVSLLLVFSAIQMVTSQVSATATRATLTVRKASPMYRSNKIFTAADVQDVKIKITASKGDQAYYAIKLQLPVGRDYSVVSGIQSKHDAQWIADRIKETLRDGP